MTRSTSRPPRKPKSARDGQNRPALVFRDFVRQLEKLDARSLAGSLAKPPKAARGAQA